MGCDIHSFFEVRVPAGPRRGRDRDWRAMQRQVSSNPEDLELRARFWELSAFSPWTFARGNLRLVDDYWLEHDDTGWYRQKNLQIQALKGRELKNFHQRDFYSLLVPDFDPDRGPWDNEWDDDRSYMLFAALTGTVRNHDGKPGITPRPRELPKNLSTFGWFCYGEMEESNNVGAHSASFLTLEEILDWPGWSQPTPIAGLVIWHTYKEWASWEFAGNPGMSFRAGGGLRLDRAEFDRLIEAGEDPEHLWACTMCEWEISLEEDCASFLKLCRRWASTYGAANVRMTFWFDN